ncbi:cytochrome c/FTR1 family iron permease [Arcticibacter eurypsychrophilus]|uniref:cytochrome c/FTR1 family iron permease n=1 Tax=Arcticibacter eurypsychrophilus TaxID=1434752 RepID=UPI00084D1807|nr:FTR1 family protein [Arcticibacter eurypsychrophilus]
MKFKFTFFTALLLWVSSPSFAQTESNENEIRTLVTLLDYVAKDYAGAVTNGKIINETEYLEITEFTKNCIILQNKIKQKVNKPAFSSLGNELRHLLKLVQNKASTESIAYLSRQIKEQILAMGLMKLSPKNWPSLKSGMVIYNKNCVSCHGTIGGGDGALAANLSPKPTNFQDNEAMSNLSPLQAYNIIKLGLDGTPMRSFNELSEAELWDVSFYLMSLRHKGTKTKKDFLKVPGIDRVSRLTDKELNTYLTKQNFKISLAQVRNHQPKVMKPLELAKFNLDASLQAYKDRDKILAQSLALTAYLEGVELVEAPIRATDSKLIISVERAMINYRAALKGDDLVLVGELNALAKQEVNKADALLRNKAYSYSFTYGAALSILLREALEALIIITVVLSVLKPLNIKKAINYIHLGWILALIVGAASWFFIESLIKLSGSNRELMEGVGSIIAVAVLIYMGAWLHSKSEVKKWKEFVEQKMKKVAESGNWYLLMFFSFIIVFREAFEVVLFLATLKLDVPDEGSSAIGWAVVTAAVLVSVSAILILRYSKRLPLRQLFKLSAYVVAVLTVVLTGKGFRALQEAAYFSETLLNDAFRFEALGIYPTFESLFAQLTILVVVVALWQFQNYKGAEGNRVLITKA